jgi:hypothetical protein
MHEVWQPASRHAGAKIQSSMEARIQEAQNAIAGLLVPQ